MDVKQGVATSNNLRFLRFWWEVDEDDISKDYKQDKRKWVPYQKGGEYKKWYGNNWLVVNWENEGQELKTFDRAVLRNQEYYFKKGITFGKTSTKNASFRLLNKGNISGSQSPAIFTNKNYNNKFFLIGYLNAKLTSFVNNSLNTTVAIQVGDIKRFPFIKPNKKIENIVKRLSQENINQKKLQYKYDIIEKEFESNPLDFNWKDGNINVEERLKAYVDFKSNSECKILINEALIDELIFDVYELTDSDREMVLDQEGIPEGLFPVLEGDRGKFIKDNDLQEEVVDFIYNLSIETKRSRVNLKDNVKILYKKNKSVQEIAKEIELNPISVVEIIKEFDFYPKKLAYQKAHEFMLDLIREILMENEDGIVIVNEYAGEDPLDKKIVGKLYDKGFTSGDVDRLENMLGKTIKYYLLDSFFSDECKTLNLFMYQPKTPFIWHLSSGKEQGFDAFIIIYRWNRDKILKIKSYYLDKRRTGVSNRLNNLTDDNSATAEKEKDRLRKQLQEIEEFENKLDKLLSSGYNPELDDGVGKNIAPLQDFDLVADDVLTNSQLKKFLDADW